MNHQEQEKFKSLYNPIHTSLDKFCRVIAGNKMDAEDLLHDTVLMTMKSFDKIRNQDAMLSYMFSIASNLMNRRRKRNQREVIWEEAEVGQMTGKEISSEVLTDFKIIHEKMLALPDKMSEALILFYVSDLKLDEIQKIQGGSLSGVKLRIKRGRERLVQMLEERPVRTMVYLFL